jgi:drug/metabolite transporter (DMT)-like permease
MVVASFVLDEHMPAVVTFRSAFAWVYLIVFGSIIGFSAYLYLLRHARPSVALSHAYVNPIVAVILGALIGGEDVSWTTALATAFIAAGVMASMTGRR